MMSKTMQDALNEQMKHEFYSSYLYLSMSAFCDRANLPGLARWMRGAGAGGDQARDEDLRSRAGPRRQGGAAAAGPSARRLRLAQGGLRAGPPARAAGHGQHQQGLRARGGRARLRQHRLSRLVRAGAGGGGEDQRAPGRAVSHGGRGPPGLLMLDRELGQRKSGGCRGRRRTRREPSRRPPSWGSAPSALPWRRDWPAGERSPSGIAPPRARRRSPGSTAAA